MKKMVFAVLSVFLFFGCQSKTDLNVVAKIALVAPITGDLAAMGQGMKNAAQMAVDEYQHERGRCSKNDYKDNGIIVELAAFDDRADPKEAVNIANQIISDRRIIGVVGHLNSGCSIPASSIYNRYNLAMISPASTNPKLTQQGFKNVFRTCTTDEVQGCFAADFAYHKLGIKKVVIIHDKTPYGQGLAEEFSKKFQTGGGKILSFDGINIGDKDFNALLTQLKSLSPQAIFFGGVYGEGGLISRQAKGLGLKVPLIGGDALKSPEYVDIGGDATEGDIITMIGLSPDKLPRAKEFITRYTNIYPQAKIQPYDAATYDTTKMIIEAIRSVGSDKTKIIDYIAKIQYPGIIGRYSFDEKGDTNNKTISIYKIKNGEFLALE